MMLNGLRLARRGSGTWIERFELGIWPRIPRFEGDVYFGRAQGAGIADVTNVLGFPALYI